jgi:hypothetical protein
MPLEVADIILSNAIVYQAPEGTALPADTVAAGADWAGDWERVGYTNEPLTMAYEYEIAEPDIQESMAPIKRLKISENASFETVLAELSADALTLAWEGAVTTTAPGALQPGKDTYNVGGKRDLTVRAWGFEGQYESALGNIHPIRLLIYRGTATEGGELEFSKSAYTGIPLKIGALSEMDNAAGSQLFKIVKITAPATA